jgi:hypothetical protein
VSNVPPTPPINNLVAMLMAFSTKKYLHVAVAFGDHSIEFIANNEVQKVINEANDWLRYASNCWIVWTSDTPQQLYQKLVAIPQLKQSSVLVVKLDLSDRAGQFPPWIWEWIDKTRY